MPVGMPAVVIIRRKPMVGVATELVLGVLCGTVVAFVICQRKINALIPTPDRDADCSGLCIIRTDKAVIIEAESFLP